MLEKLGINSLFAELTLGLGLALLLGNGYAWWKHRRGERPDGIEGEFRRGRATFLMVVGALMAVWGAASL